MTTWTDIIAIIEARRATRGPVVDMMIAVRDRYQADYVIPDPSGATDDPSPILTPAIIAQAIDQPALRAASVIPNVFVPALDPAAPNGKGSSRYAARRRSAVLASWHDSRLPLLLRRSFRQLRAYDTTCFVVEWDTETHMPLVRLRDPLTAYPEPKVPEDMTLPTDCGFIHGKSAEWVRQTYPQSRMEAGGPVPKPGKSGDETWDLVEWIDEDAIVIGILGPRYQMYDRTRANGPVRSDMELTRFPNRAGCCPVVCPQTVTLDQVSSQIAKIIGNVDLMAQMTTLQIAAAQRAIYPDRYVIGRGTAAPQIVGGKWKEGRTGEINVILDADTIGEIKGEPGVAADRIVDRLERNARVTSGLTPQMTGEAGGTVPRTGRGLDTLGAWSSDPQVQELQELMQYSLEAVNKAILSTYVGYAPDRKYVDVFYGLGGLGEFASFTPNKELAESTDTKVSYAIAGADKQGTTVQLGQMVGAGLMSQETARLMHPDIPDGASEARRILEEQLDEALRTGILQRTVQGGPDGIAIVDAAKIRAAIRAGKTIDEAVLEVDEARRKEQAGQSPEEQGPGEPPALPPGAPGPEQMPGLAGPEEGVGVPAPGGIQPPPAPLERFRQLAGALSAGGGQ